MMDVVQEKRTTDHQILGQTCWVLSVSGSGLSGLGWLHSATHKADFVALSVSAAAELPH